jgi:hypothetical protein
MVLLGGLIAVLLAGCGSGGGGGSVAGPSSGGDGTSTAELQGNLVQSGASASRGPVYVVLLDRVLGIRDAEAAVGDPVVGATVILTPSGGGTPIQTTTDATGHFEFHHLLPGSYTLSVKIGAITQPLDPTSTTPITVGAGDLGVIEGKVTQSAIVGDVHVAAEPESADGIFQSDAQLGHAMNIAAAAHVSLEDVVNFRLAGNGWGNVAKHFNVSPGVIGLGRSNLSDSALDATRASHGHGKPKNKS